MPIQYVREFLQKESASGLLIILAALLALVAVNTPLESLYDDFLETPVVIQVGKLIIDKPLLLWINDGLMAVFFFLVGLEIKREVLDGELSDPSRLALPAIAAIGGMLVPAAFFTYFNHDDPVAMSGWAIPMATDIAFVVGCLSILGRRVPHTLKIFVLSLAIIDDLGAILIVAFVYSKGISWIALAIAAAALLGVHGLVRARVSNLWAYAPVAFLAWLAFHESGVHATLSGVLLGLLAPARPFPGAGADGESLLHRAEKGLHPVVALGIMPVFALANAGVPLVTEGGVHPETLAVALGLLVGKPLGIVAFSWLAVRTGASQLPDQVSWGLITGAGCLAGIGFTMAAFIAGLALEGAVLDAAKLGVMAGSAAAGVLGTTVIVLSTPRQAGRA